MHWRRKWQPTPVFLPGESQGRGSVVGCRLWGRTESDTTEVTYQQCELCLCSLTELLAILIEGCGHMLIVENAVIITLFGIKARNGF